MSLIIKSWLGMLLAVPMALAGEQPLSLIMPTNETFSGWESPQVLTGGDCRMVVVPAVGGRVMFFAVNGENLIHLEPGSGGKTLATESAPFLVGGYQCDVGPELRGLPEHPTLWLGPAQVTRPRPNTLLVRGTPDAALGLQIDKEIVMAPDSGEVGLTQRLKNTGDRPSSFCLWDRTACRGSGFLLLPLPKRSQYRAGYGLRQPNEPKYTDAQARPTDPRFKSIEGTLVVQARGEAFQLGADGEVGWVAYTVGRALLVKWFPVTPKGLYSNVKHVVQAAVNEKYIEVGPLSPEIKLAPGESFAFAEKWALFDLDQPVNSFVEAHALVKRIPPSPFKR